MVRLGPEDRLLIMLIIQVEACDLFGGFLTAQSMAGGTGSGLGKIHLLPTVSWYPLMLNSPFTMSKV